MSDIENRSQVKKSSLSRKTIPVIRVIWVIWVNLYYPYYPYYRYYRNRPGRSNHPLAIEIGRQKNPKTPREERICTVCEENAIEDEEHFLLKCPTYSILREHHRMNFENVPDMLNTDDQYQLSKYLISAYELRLRLDQGRRGEQDNCLFYVFCLMFQSLCLYFLSVYISLENIVFIRYFL